MTPKEKRKLLARLFFLLIQTGYDIEDLIGKPLSYFDYDKIKLRILQLEKEYENQ
jgi:hypothetical protein